MEINTKVLLAAENDFRSYRNRVEMINEETRSVMLKVSSLKGIYGVSSKLNRICGELDGIGNILSQMSCLLEMAAETYNRTEEKNSDKRDSTFRRTTFFFTNNNRTVTPLPRYVDPIPSGPTINCYRIQNMIIRNYFFKRKNDYLDRLSFHTNNRGMKTYQFRNKTEIISVLSTIGRFV